jgi:hypothetical protein
MGLTELVVGLEVLRSLVRISLWITFQPTGLLAWLHGRFGMWMTWLRLRKKKGFVRGLFFTVPRLGLARRSDAKTARRTVFHLIAFSAERCNILAAAHGTAEPCEDVGLGTRTENLRTIHEANIFTFSHLYHDESLVVATIGQLENYSGTSARRCCKRDLCTMRAVYCSALRRGQDMVGGLPCEGE